MRNRDLFKMVVGMAVFVAGTFVLSYRAQIARADDVGPIILASTSGTAITSNTTNVYGFWSAYGVGAYLPSDFSDETTKTQWFANGQSAVLYRRGIGDWLRIDNLSTMVLYLQLNVDERRAADSSWVSTPTLGPSHFQFVMAGGPLTTPTLEFRREWYPFLFPVWNIGVWPYEPDITSTGTRPVNLTSQTLRIVGR